MKIFAACFWLLCSLSLFAQKKKQSEKLFLYDNDWKPASSKNAVFMMAQQQNEDSTVTQRTYYYAGPIIREETYLRPGSDVLHGYIAFFGDDGQIDSSGYVWEGRKDSVWFFYDDTLAAIVKKEYLRGELIKVTDLVTERKQYENSPLDSTEKEAIFKGGSRGWLNFLGTHYNQPERAMSMGISGTAKIFFVVGSDGSIQSPRIFKSVEYSIDKEAIRLIRLSPKWIPAEKAGKKLKAFRIQPITFTT